MKQRDGTGDFPIQWPEDQSVTRRQFAKALSGLSAACFTCTAALAVKSAIGDKAPEALAIAGGGALAVGQSLSFQFDGQPCLLVRLPDGLHAFSQSCTHLGCPVLFDAAHSRFDCPCHAGFFDAKDGSVLAGPPQRPLRRVRLEQLQQQVWARAWDDDAT
jgi:cytochrome b6-f complex iron-sulfur subunit